ncbi:MAG: PPE domain-containing protein [Mycobacterium sp.]
MDFALLPPEVNSARMYAGPGSPPLVAAAIAWDGLSAELRAAGALYGSVIEELTAGSWLGPASASMASAAGPYVEWMTVTAAQAEQAAIQAKAAAAAYEVTFAATVPPPIVATNRAQLTALVATNIFGQNTAAIAATETHYAEMWAQDAMAMYGYAGVSAAATTLTPFTSPPQSVNPDGLGAQAAAVAHSAAATAATNTQTMLTHVTAAVPAALQGLASPTSAAGIPSLLTSLASITPATVVSTTLEVSDVSVGTSGLVTASGAWVDASKSDYAIHDTAVEWHENAKNQLREIMARFDQLGTVGSTVSPELGGAPSAQVGEAASVGRLSVPQGWTEAAPAMRLAAVGLPTASFAAAPAALAGSASSASSLFSELALAGMAGRALSGPLVPGARERAAAAGDPAASGKRSSRSPGSQGSARSAADPPAGIAAEIREFAEVLGRLGELRASGLLTEEEFAEQKQRLLGR